MTKLIEENSTVKEYIKAFGKLDDSRKPYEFEDYCGFFLMQHISYGPDVYTSNQPNKFFKKTPKNLQKLWGIENLGIKAVDWYCDSKTFGATGVSVKYQHDDKKSINKKKSGTGDSNDYLAKTNIEKKILITNVDGVTKDVHEYADGWDYIYGGDVWSEDAYQNIRNIVLSFNKQTKVTKTLTPVSYRISENGPDKGTDSFHRDSMAAKHNTIMQHLLTTSSINTLSIKPTAAGKGNDPILYWKDFLKPSLIKENPKKKTFITCTVNPHLTVLRGNLDKQLYDIQARKDLVDVFVLASAIGRDEKEELNGIGVMAKIVDQFKLDEEIEKKVKQGGHIHIETTIHSYWKLKAILESQKLVGDYLYIDEVKNTVVDEDSRYAECLWDYWRIREGADANVVEAKDKDKNQLPTSMKNTTTWPVIGTEWQEIDVTSRNWKRQTKLELSMYDVTRLPVQVSKLFKDRKNGLIIKDSGFVVNLEWRLFLESLAIKLLNSNRKYPLVKLTTVKRSLEFQKYATKVWPSIVKQHGDSKRPEIKRLLKFSFLSIYSAGNSHDKIINLVDNVVNDYPDGCIVLQVKKLCEGWDPTDGWVDMIGFADSSASKTLISQFIGRGARLDANREKMDLPVMIINLINSLEDFSVPNIFKVISQVADDLELGENINDTITFHDYTNKGQPSSAKSRGVKYFKGIFTQGGWLNAFAGYKKDGNTSPYTYVVEELYDLYADEWYTSIHNNKKRKEVNNKILKDKRFSEFFEQYKDEASKGRQIFGIMSGNYFCLTFDTQKQARKRYQLALISKKQNYRNDAMVWYRTTENVLSNLNAYNYIGLKRDGIVTRINKLVRTKCNINEKNRISADGVYQNKTFVKNYPVTGKIIVDRYTKLINNFVNDVNKKTKQVRDRFEYLQTKTVNQSFGGTVSGLIKDKIMEEFNIIPDEKEFTLGQLKSKIASSLTKEQCESYLEGNRKTLVEVFKKYAFSGKFETVDELWDVVTKELEKDDFIITRIDYHNIVRPNLSKSDLKKFDEQTNQTRGKVVAKNRKSYIVGSAKEFVAQGKTYPSKGHAERELGYKLNMLENFRADLFYWKDKGPGKPTEFVFYTTPKISSSKNQAFHADNNTEFKTPGYWWTKMTSDYPEKYYKEIRIAEIEEILQKRIHCNMQITAKTQSKLNSGNFKSKEAV